MRIRRERKIEEITEAVDAGGNNRQLDIEGIKINGEEYLLKVVNCLQKNGSCHLELSRRNGDKYKIFIDEDKVGLFRDIGLNHEVLVQLINDDLGGLINMKKGDIHFQEYGVGSDKDYKQLEFPFLPD